MIKLSKILSEVTGPYKKFQSAAGPDRNSCLDGMSVADAKKALQEMTKDILKGPHTQQYFKAINDVWNEFNKENVCWKLTSKEDGDDSTKPENCWCFKVWFTSGDGVKECIDGKLEAALPGKPGDPRDSYTVKMTLD